MHYLFEESDLLNAPVECFIYDAAQEKNFPVKNHWHYFMEIIYMTEGKAEMNADGKTYLVKEGDMIVFHPKAVHAIYSVDKSLPKYILLKFDIGKFNMNPAYAPKLASIFQCAKKNEMPIFFPSEIAGEMKCGELLKSCIDEMKRLNYGYDLAVKSEIYNLLIRIIRKWVEMGMIISSNACPSDNELGIDSVTEYIDSGIQENLKVNEIAEKCGMSYSGFAKQFRSVYGMSCKEYIERMRIFRVEEFLLFTDFDLNYISQETGFSDCSHMIKSFKALRGITPKQFRMAKARDRN